MNAFDYLMLACLLALGGFCALLLGPLFFGRLFLPRLTLRAFTRFSHLLAGLLDRISPGLDLKLMAQAGNRYFREQFAATPFGQRLCFLPFCLKPPQCTAPVSREEGLICPGECPDCRLGETKRLAEELGYGGVWVVPSSRILKGRGLLPSDQFIKHKIETLAPRAALGVVCPHYLRERLLPHFAVGRRGFKTEGGSRTVPQGVLLRNNNCRRAQVDWDALRLAVALGRETAASPAPLGEAGAAPVAPR